MKVIDKGWIRGVAYAVQILEGRGENTLAGYLLNQSGVTLQDCKDAGVDEYDFKPTRLIARKERVSGWNKKAKR